MQKKLHKDITRLLLVLMTATSCEIIGDIFQAGMGVGIFLVIVVIAVIVLIISKLGRRQIKIDKSRFTIPVFSRAP